MPFLIFTVLGFVVLRLTFRARFKTLIILAVLIGLVADFGLDLLVAVRP